jgi:hypothetical protein
MESERRERMARKRSSRMQAAACAIAALFALPAVASAAGTNMQGMNMPMNGSASMPLTVKRLPTRLADASWPWI